MKKKFALLLCIAVLFAGCERYDHAIQDLNDRIEVLEGASIATIEEQISLINASLTELTAADAALSDYTATLEATAATLKEELAATDAQIDALKSELQGENAATKQTLLDQLAALKSTIEADIKDIEQEIAALKAKDAALEGQITGLKSYVDGHLAELAEEMNGGATDTEAWAKATFATLAQYDSLQTEVSAIKASIEELNTAIETLETRVNNKIATDIAAAVDSLGTVLTGDYTAKIVTAVSELTTAYTAAIATAKEEITAAYTEAIATAIADSEASMKQWVNETLAEGYYDIATIDGKLAALDTKVDSLDEALTEQLAAQQAALNAAKSELTAAYTEAITAAIETNNGVIDTKIANAIATAKAELQSQIDTINATLANLQSQIDAINSTIATIEQQITNITASIEDLEEVDEALKALIESLQAEAEDLQSQLAANSAADAATKQALEAEIANLNTLIAALQAKDTELEQQIADLKDYVDTEIGATEDWAEATFATLTQYTAMQTELATLTALIETYKQELTDAYTAAIAEAVSNMQTNLTALETSMKAWVNETLAAGYYDIATIDGKLTALQATLDALAANGATDQELAAAIAAQQAALNAAKSELTAAYEAAIATAINDNNGVIDTKIAEAIATAKAEMQSQIDAITTEITAIKSRLTALESKVDALIARIQSIRYLPEYSDGKVELTSDNAPVMLTFLLSPNEAAQAVAAAYQSNNGVVTAYLSRTQSRTRAVDAPTAINVTSVAGTAEGMLAVTINPASLPADYWATAEDANLFIRISDGNNDVISEMIPTFYTVTCNLPDGSTFRTAVHNLMTDDTKAIKFIANSPVVTDKQIGTAPAYMQLNGTTLEIHTRAKEFVFNADCSFMFSGSYATKFKALTSIDFNDCVNTANVTNMRSMFFECTALASLNLSKFNTANVTNMSNMFYYCSALASLNLSSFNTEKVTSMSYMFSDCTALASLDLSSFNTEKVTDMGSMFKNCSALTSLNLSSFNTEKVTSMSYMFSGCSALTSLDLSSFNTAEVTFMRNMFSSCKALTSLDIRNFNIDNVTNIDAPFYKVGEEYNKTTGNPKTSIMVTSTLKTALTGKYVSLGNFAEYVVTDEQPM